MLFLDLGGDHDMDVKLKNELMKGQRRASQGI
jgi:hypothetical protein